MGQAKLGNPEIEAETRAVHFFSVESGGCRPRKGVEISLFGRHDKAGTEYKFTTDANGYFAQDVEPGTYTVLAKDSSIATHGLVKGCQIRVTEDGGIVKTRDEIEIKTPTSVDIYCVETDGTPVANVSVTLSGSSTYDLPPTNADGWTGKARIPNGTYIINTHGFASLCTETIENDPTFTFKRGNGYFKT